jgi:alcohol dehydrogenase
MLSNEVACPANCATATVHAALTTVGDLSGKRVLILGLGLLGLTACAMSAWFGAQEILACDLDEQRLTISQRFGAHHIAKPNELAARTKQITSGYGFDLAIDFTGSPDICSQALQCLRIGGQLVLVGAVFPSGTITLPLEEIVRRQLRIQGIHNYAPHDLGEAIRFLESNPQYPFAELFGGWFDLTDIERAIQFTHDHRPIRIGLCYDSPPESLEASE